MGLFSSDTKTNPFADAEERMHHNMMKAEGENADETFVRKMIEHHRGALEMGEIAHREVSDPELHAMISKSSADQQKEIDELQSWLQRRGKSAQ